MREVMLIVHFLGLSMGLGTALAHAFLGIAAAKMSPDEATKFRLHSLVLSRMGNIGLILLLISGTYLVLPYWDSLYSMPLLMLKLALVAVLIILISAINFIGKKALTANSEEHLKKMETLGKITLLVAVTILIVAVNIFH